jgi:hypothetical protein
MSIVIQLNKIYRSIQSVIKQIIVIIRDLISDKVIVIIRDLISDKVIVIIRNPTCKQDHFNHDYTHAHNIA